MSRILSICILLLLAAASRADIVHLRDGTRYYGDLISQDENAVTFRVVTGGGAASFIRVFPPIDVIRVERTVERTPPEATTKPAPTSQPVTSKDAGDTLQTAFKTLDSGNLKTAVRQLQLIVNGAKSDELTKLDAATRAARGTGLAELLADARLKFALSAWPAKPLQLNGATHYESIALAKLLESKANELLGHTYAGRTIAAWPTSGDDYIETLPDTRRMVEDASLATALLSARLRVDYRLNKDRAARHALLTLRDDLARFTSKVITLPGYTKLRSDPAENVPASQPATQPTTQPADESESHDDSAETP